MRTQWIRAWRWYGLLGVVLVIVGCQPSVQTARVKAFAAAQAQWNARPFQHYQFTVQFPWQFVPCEQEVEVRNEQVVQVLRTTCVVNGLGVAPGQTVSTVFAQMQPYVTSDRTWVNGPHGDALQYDIAYDPALGYPVHMHIRSGPPPFVRQLPNLLRRQGCTLMAWVDPSIEVTALTPLP